LLTKTGKFLFSRQYVEMTRAGVEGLLAAFAKLCLETPDPERQHTYTETESVRYLYQPMEELVMVLITSKTSNIVDDLDTLHLYTKLVSTYCRQLNERCLLESVWDLIFAFDEPITYMGYKERVSVGQIKSFVEMDSHEEKMKEMDVQEKIRNAQRKANEMAQQLREQREAMERQAKMQGGMRSSAVPSMAAPSYGAQTQVTPPAPTAYVVRDSPKAAESTQPASRGMQLGKSKAQSNDFLDQVAKEDRGFAPRAIEPVVEKDTKPTSAAAPPVPKPTVKRESVHVSIQETLRIRGVVDGIVDSMDVIGELAVTIADPAFAKLSIKTTTNPKYQYSTHPQIDKARFTKENGLIAAKDVNRPFPTGNAITVAKWRLQAKEALPVIVNCWPNIFEQGITLTIECTAGSATDLSDVTLTIPCPYPPDVNQSDGEHRVENGKIVWVLPIIDDDIPSGTIEFTCAGTNLALAEFFPISVTYTAPKSLSGLEVEGVFTGTSESVPFSTETSVKIESFNIYSTLADAQAGP